MRALIPYFILAVGMVLFSQFFNYRNLIEELIINSVLFIFFIIFTEHRDKLLSLFLRKEKNENKDN